MIKILNNAYANPTLVQTIVVTQNTEVEGENWTIRIRVYPDIVIESGYSNKEQCDELSAEIAERISEELIRLKVQNMPSWPMMPKISATLDADAKE